jgi:hypothetical protein
MIKWFKQPQTLLKFARVFLIGFGGAALGILGDHFGWFYAGVIAVFVFCNLIAFAIMYIENDLDNYGL